MIFPFSLGREHAEALAQGRHSNKRLFTEEANFSRVNGKG